MGPRPYPTLSLGELERELNKLTDEQHDQLDAYCSEWFSRRSTAADRYLAAVRLGWLMGPA